MATASMNIKLSSGITHNISENVSNENGSTNRDLMYDGLAKLQKQCNDVLTVAVENEKELREQHSNSAVKNTSNSFSEEDADDDEDDDDEDINGEPNGNPPEKKRKT